jgi:PAS domain S-box-containing protein
MTPPDDAPMRSIAQKDLEIDPADHDPSANEDVGSIDIAPAGLFKQALEQTRMAVTLVDVHRPDSPIIYANRAFTELTGFEREDIVGRNCRFLQGPDTDPASVEAIRKAIAAREVRVVEILNYRKDGSTFWNSLHIGPVYDDAGELTHLYGSQWDVTDLVEERNRLAIQLEVAEELQHRTGNLFGVISAIVNLSARGETDVPGLVRKIGNRLVALGKAHAISISGARTASSSSDLYDLVATILEPYRAQDGDRIAIRGAMVQVPRDAVTPLGLMLHELATNALKYGALSTPGGTVTLSWAHEDGRLRLIWTEEAGRAVEAPEVGGSGTRMIGRVMGAIGGTVTSDWPPAGLRATVDMPFAR